MKVVINRCYGGFGLSDEAYEKLIEWGVPVQKYYEQKRDPETNRYLDEPKNDGEVIFDRTLTPPEEDTHGFNDADHIRLMGRYWETWIDRENRTHPLLIRVVEELGKKANGRHARLKVVEIPDDVEYEIDEYDGIETIHEKHRSWS